MTMIRDMEVKCSICGKVSSQPVLLSTNTNGWSDLDLRPAEMKRSTMNTWVLECPHCGYVAGNLEDDCGISKDFLESERYLACDGLEFKGRLSPRFYRLHMIMDELGDAEGCFYNLLHCAWDCDDKGDAENAAKVRKLAIGYIEKLIPEKDDVEKNNLILMKADLLRRSGQFERVVEEYEKLFLGDGLLDAVITFQIKKANLSDTGCYTVEDVIKTF